jgi:Predicted nucleotide-binding protein containing TIR-like domain
MARKNAGTPEPRQKPMLIVARAGAKHQLQTQIDKGKEFLIRPIQTSVDLEAIRQEHSRWDDFNYDLLRAIFSTEEHAQGYRMYGYGGGEFRTLQEGINKLHEDVEYDVNRLESMRDRLGLFAEDPGLIRSTATSEKQHGRLPNKVFVVHGHDELTKQTVARFIEKLGLEAVILHERANQGKTVIEKIEMNADVGYAVVLLTPTTSVTAKPLTYRDIP